MWKFVCNSNLSKHTLRAAAGLRCDGNGSRWDSRTLHTNHGTLRMPNRHEQKSFFTKTEILEIYKSTFKGLSFSNSYSLTDFYIVATYSGDEIDPKGVFANNELDMGQINIWGFDYDYTLACYKESLHYLIYELGRDALINNFQVSFKSSLWYNFKVFKLVSTWYSRPRLRE